MDFNMDKLSYEIFSILESKFLFSPSPTPRRPSAAGRVRILSIDGGAGPADGLLAAAALCRLESLLQHHSRNPAARLADFFDVAAGSSTGGLLAAMLFTPGPDSRPLFTAEQALHRLAKHNRRGSLARIFRRSGGSELRRAFGGATLRDALKPLLVPCYDLATAAPFLFSRADAAESDAFDFRIRDVCAATCAAAAAVEARSADGRTRIAAVGGAAAMPNPTAAAITHVLNNKKEFPAAAGVEDLLVVSLGGGEADLTRAPPPAAQIAAESAADMVDQSVAMAFGHNRTTNYVRIQASGFGSKSSKMSRSATEAALEQRSVESVLFRGKMMSEKTNAEKLEWFSSELLKEEERRKRSANPVVVIKQATLTPRTSSPTITTTIVSSTNSMSP